MPEMVALKINGTTVRVSAGTTVAAAVMGHVMGHVMGQGVAGFRRSVSGEARAPLCGMGMDVRTDG